MMTYLQFTSAAAGSFSLSEMFRGLFHDAASHFIYFGPTAYCCSFELPRASLLIHQLVQDSKGYKYILHILNLSGWVR